MTNSCAHRYSWRWIVPAHVLWLSVIPSAIADVVFESTPASGVEARASVGSTIYYQVIVDRHAEVTQTTAQNNPAVLKAPLEMAVVGGTVVATEGQTVEPQVFDGQMAYVVSVRETGSPAYLLDRTQDSAFDEVWSSKGKLFPKWSKTVLPVPIPYVVAAPTETTRVVRPARSEEEFRRELVYLGFSKGTLRVQYREFRERLARDAFYQELAYDIDSFPATVSFRSLRLEILGADNNEIRYRIFGAISQ